MIKTSKVQLKLTLGFANSPNQLVHQSKYWTQTHISLDRFILTRTSTVQTITEGIHKVIRLMVVLFGIFACCMCQFGCDGKEWKPPKIPFVRATHGNVTDRPVWVRSTRVLSQELGTAAVGTFYNYQNSITLKRRDLTPDALLKTKAKFVWWNCENFNKREMRKQPDDPAKILKYSVPFPRLDSDDNYWHFKYTLHDNNVWVGMFHGTKAKVIGAKPAPTAEDQHWFHCHFHNLSGAEVTVYGSSEFVCGRREKLEEYVIPNKSFRGFSAQSQEGSIFRPTKESTIEIRWELPGGKDAGKQSIHLPKFDPEKKNWYVYATLDSAGTWSPVFEGALRSNERKKAPRTFDRAPSGVSNMRQ